MYTWDYIQNSWLAGSDINPSPGRTVEAFNVVARMFGQDWVERTRRSEGFESSGSSPTLHIIAIGTMLSSLSDVNFSQTFLSKLSDQDRDYRAELEAMYLLRRHDKEVQIEYEPVATVGDTVRKPDFRTRHNPPDWIYVEVTRPSISEAQSRVNEHLKRLSSAVHCGSQDFSVEVYFEREPLAAEVEAVYEQLADSRNHGLAGETHLHDGLGSLFWNTATPGQFEVVDRGGPDTPRIGVVGFSAGPGSTRHVAVRWPFADGRAAEVLKKEAKQLPVDAPGLIMINASSASGATTTWRSAIERRFQPNIHTRVSAVCIWTSQLVATPSGEDWRLRAELITNPYARHPLPDWIITEFPHHSPTQPPQGPPAPGEEGGLQHG